MSDDGSVNGRTPPRRPLKVLEVIGNAIVGGMETYTRNLIVGLDPDEFEVTCLLPYESAYTASLRELGCKVYLTPIQDDPLWRSIEMMSEIIRQHRIDVVHANLANAHTLAGVVGKMSGTPTVATLHSRTLWIQELSVARVTGMNLITVCQEAYAQALACGIAPENLSLIHNGVDLERFSPSRSGAAFREALGIGPGTPLVGFVGRLAFEKGPDKFVQAALRVCQQRPDVQFAVVGEGPVESELRNMIDGAGFGGRIHMAGLRRDVETIYPAFDVMIQTSRSEAMPLALLEAMASGVATIAFSVGGVPELIESGTTGLLVSPAERPGLLSPYPGDWEGIAAATLDILSRPERLRAMGTAARTRAAGHFDLRKSVSETAALFQRLARPAIAKGAGWQPTVVRDKGETGRVRVKAAPVVEEAMAAIVPVRAADTLL